MRGFKTCQAVVALAVLVGTTPPASAAEIGAKVGPTVAQQKTDAGITADSRWGLRMSFFARWAVLANVNLTGEIGYIQRGARNATLTSGGQTPNPLPTSKDHRLDYITIPLVADVGLDAKRIVFFGGAGPRVDVLVNDAFSRESDTLSDYYENFDRFVFGATLVGGVRLPDGRVSLEFQYNWDVTDSYSASNAIYFRSRALDILLGFGF